MSESAADSDARPGEPGSGGAPADAVPATGRPTGSSGPATFTLGATVAALVAAALGLTWWRLLRGADLVDEAYFVLVPWRWALGDRPFVDEQDLSQAAGLLAYPFVKLFALARGNDVTGLVLYERHLYLALAVGAAVCVYLLARRSLPRAAAALVAPPLATLVLFETPQLTANTLGALLLTVAAALGGIAVLGGPRGYVLAAGAAFGLACVAYPTVLLLAPFVAVLLAFSVGEGAVGAMARWSEKVTCAGGSRGGTAAMPGEAPAPVPAAPPECEQVPDTTSGHRAWRALSAWTLGAALVVAPVVALVVVLAGADDLRRCWQYTLSLADELDQLGGAAKAVEVVAAFVGLLADQWFLVALAVVALVVFRVRRDAGRWLLLLVPPALWLTATTSDLRAAGAAIVFALAAPYLYLFVPVERHLDGARLLCWIWTPAAIIGAMTAYTSAEGFVRSAVGLLPAVALSGLLLAWALEPLGRQADPGRRGTAARGGEALGRARPAAWPAVLGLGAVVVVTLAFQVQFQPGEAAVSDLSRRVESGPWQGIAVTAEQHRLLASFERDLAAQARPDDSLLIYPRGAGLYLYWPGEIAANTYQLTVTQGASPLAPLPKGTVSFYRRRKLAPTLVVHLTATDGKSADRLRAECGGLDYPPVVTAPWYAFQRRPPGESVGDVLARLPEP